MAYKIKKLKTFRFDESTLELLEKAKANHIVISRFVRKAVKEQFKRDYPKWIEEQQKKNIEYLPF